MLSASRTRVGPGGGAVSDGPLENTGNNLSPRTDGRVEKRSLRWSLRSSLWSSSTLQAVRQCGRIPRASGVGVTVRMREGVAGFANLQHCGSIWSCPVCSAQILTRRALEIGAVLGAAVAAGHSLGFVTLTMRHHQAQSLGLLWGAAQRGWQRAISGRGWQAAKLGGVEGWVRVWEVTDGQNGWHVHVHFVLVLPGDATAADLDVVAGGMFDRWSRGLQAAGLAAPRLVGQEWHLAAGENAGGSLAEYLMKLCEQLVPSTPAEVGSSLGMELTHTRPGRARRELATRPVWSLLEDWAQGGDVDALARWQEWEQGSKSKRQVGWSKGLRKRFVPELVEVTDEEIAGEEMGSADDSLLTITDEGWRQLCRTPAVLPLLLEVTERLGRAGLVQVLDELAVPYLVWTEEAA
jgi:hypothetical protein